jgi:hypothetical protein
MPKFLITGDSGSGKSALAEALARRGYTTYDTDDLPDVTPLEDAAGRPAGWPQPPVDWSSYGWNWQAAGLRESWRAPRRHLSRRSHRTSRSITPGSTRFSSLSLTLPRCASACCTGPATTTASTPAELAATLNTHIARQAELLSAPHAVAIDATRPLEQWQTTSSRASRPGRAREGTRAARQAAELPRHTRVKTLIKCVADVQCRCGVVPEGRWFHRRCGSDWRVGRVAVGVAGSHGGAAFAGKADLAAYKNWRTPLLDRFSAGGTGRPGQGPEHFVSTGRTLGAGTR